MAFNLPQRTSIGALTPVNPAVWVRPSDWISITGVPTGQVIFLVSDINTAKYNIDITETGVGNVTVDWGDGTNTIISSSSVVSKTYTSGGTPCSLGYNTWKITITSDPGVRITGAKITFGSDYSSTPYGLLEAWYGDNTIISANAYFDSTTIVLPSLQYVKLPEGMTESTSLVRTFVGNSSIKKIDLPSSCSVATSLDNFAALCYNLIEINRLPQDMIGLTTIASAFQSCQSLQKVIFPPTLNSVTTAGSVFRDCFSITTIVLPTSMTACTDYSQWLSNCISLTSITMPKLVPTGTLSLLFQNCANLRNVTFPNDTPSTLTLSLLNAFNGCSNLQSVTLPPNVKILSLSGAFQNCASLKSVSLPMDGSSISTMANAFNGCVSLTSFTFPSTAPSSPISMASIFATCSSISEITIPSTYQITDLSSAFNGCRNLKTVTLPTTSQTSLNTFSSTFQNCPRLQSVVLPSGLPAMINLSNMFNGCYSISGVTFPSSMPACTTMQSAFGNCYSLESVTLPTTISGNLAVCFGGTFANCNKLRSVVLPATVTANTTPNSFGSIFTNCWSLKSITLPTSNLTGIVNCSLMFNACRSLTGVTNMSSVGNSSPTGGILSPNTSMATDTRNLLSLTIVARMAKFEINGSSGFLSALNSLRFTNTGTGQWGGSSPQIDVSYTSLSTAALNTLFADIAAQGNVTSKTINITGAVGAAGLSAADRLVLTSRGWTITG